MVTQKWLLLADCRSDLHSWVVSICTYQQMLSMLCLCMPFLCLTTFFKFACNYLMTMSGACQRQECSPFCKLAVLTVMISMRMAAPTRCFRYTYCSCFPLADAYMLQTGSMLLCRNVYPGGHYACHHSQATAVDLGPH